MAREAGAPGGRPRAARRGPEGRRPGLPSRKRTKVRQEQLAGRREPGGPRPREETRRRAPGRWAEPRARRCQPERSRPRAAATQTRHLVAREKASCPSARERAAESCYPRTTTPTETFQIRTGITPQARKGQRKGGEKLFSSAPRRM